ncbi:MAG: hypothetical protein EPO21_12170 [Chloroflexota bacterium]|nr:MAG: hypothetical protein EPO21_12170 [Chloroflexota bacterium]
MGKVRLRETGQTDGSETAPAQSISLKPMRVSGVVVRKADLIEALIVYVPALRDIQVTEDGEQFWLILNEGVHDEDSTAQQ